VSLWFHQAKKRYCIRIRRRGREIARTLPAGITKGQAEALHAQLVRDHFDQAELGKRPRYTVADALNRLIEEELPRLKRPDNVLSNIRALLPHIEGRPLADIPAIADEYKHHILKPATINRRLAVLRRAANLAWREWNWLDRPITIRLLREQNARHVYLTAAQVLKLARACKLPEARDMVLIAAYTGQREGAIKNLRQDQVLTVRDKRGHLVRVIDFGVGKTGEPNRIPIHPAIRTAVARAPFAPNMRWIYTHFKRAAAAIGLPDLHFHDLRPTAASLLLDAGADEHTVGTILGHSDPRSTKRYTHLMLHAKRRAIGRLR